MHKLLAPSLVLLCAIGLPVYAQHEGHPEGHPGGGGYVPEHGPEHFGAGAPRPEFHEPENHPRTPYVTHEGHWVGHDVVANDARFHLDRPWVHGRWTGG